MSEESLFQEALSQSPDQRAADLDAACAGQPHLKVLDAGTTAAGRPYFAMELVQGVPMLRYCDELHLSIRERLELFLPVCQAIQHAHQKGIIHRDIKPSNVLVCMQDGKPVAAAHAVEGVAGEPGGAAANGARQTGQVGARRARLDRDEVPGG